MSEIATQAKMMTVNPALRRVIKVKKGTMGSKDYVEPEKKSAPTINLGTTGSEPYPHLWRKHDVEGALESVAEMNGWKPLSRQPVLEYIKGQEKQYVDLVVKYLIKQGESWQTIIADMKDQSSEYKGLYDSMIRSYESHMKKHSKN
jgi:hypothetical protein